MSIIIRPAVETDQSTIVSRIRQAKINPRNLHWEQFMIAEEDEKIVGIRQVKVYEQGTREVASGFVLPEYQHQGVSAQLMNAILARENGSLYLMCRDKWAFYYEGFGFRHIAMNQLPADFRKEYRIGRFITSLFSLFSRDKIRIISMKRE